LLGVQPRGVGAVETEEVDELARRIDLGLVTRLRLAEHRRRDDALAPRTGEQVGRLEEHGGARFPAHRFPLAARIGGGLDRLLDVRRVSGVKARDHVTVRVRHDDVDEATGGDALSADHDRNLGALSGHANELGLEARALGRALRVREDGLVDRSRNGEDRVVHEAGLPRSP
jgi:hypothetical protein